jgi:hypothetical protein
MQTDGQKDTQGIKDALLWLSFPNSFKKTQLLYIAPIAAHKETK